MQTMILTGPLQRPETLILMSLALLEGNKTPLTLTGGASWWAVSQDEISEMGEQ